MGNVTQGATEDDKNGVGPEDCIGGNNLESNSPQKTGATAKYVAPVNRVLEGNGSQKKAAEGERRDNIKLTTEEVIQAENAMKGYDMEANTRTGTRQGEIGGVDA